jgi:UV DNA damage endonuclease
MIRFGYAAQNLSIPATTNRSIRLANLGDAERVRSLVRAILASVRQILEWNGHHGVGLFRIGQSLIPFASHPLFPYDWRAEHAGELADLGRYARALGIRISMHPGQYIQPGSPNAGVVANALTELRYVAAVFDLMECHDATIVLHMGGAYGDYARTADRFANVMSAERTVLRYLALEGDERIWSIEEIEPTAASLQVPLIVDTLHHRMNPGKLSLRSALDHALPTWTMRGVRPKVHISSQDPAKRPGAHAFGIDLGDWEELMEASGGREIDVMIEAKGKDRALAGLGLITAGHQLNSVNLAPR